MRKENNVQQNQMGTAPIWKLLQLFNLRNLSLVIGVTAAAFVCFAVFYALIYRLTAGAYYAIVAAGGEDA